MKRLLLTTLIALGAGFSAFGQAFPRYSFSVEAGAAPGPLHMHIRHVSPTREAEAEQADLGRKPIKNDRYYPAFTLSGVLRIHEWGEVVLTAGVSWSHSRVIQYETFGIDPQGKPRFDLTKSAPAGWVDLSPAYSLTLQGRAFWYPEMRVQLYSAYGLGITTIDTIHQYTPSVSLIPIGCRFGGRHLYLYAEAGFTPFASYIHGGAGYAF